MNRRYTGKRYGTAASKQEAMFLLVNPRFKEGYQPSPLIYTSTYRPDWFLGIHRITGKPIYLELKEWLDPSQLPKLLSVVECNDIHLVILAENIRLRDLDRLNNHPRIQAFQASFALPPIVLEQLAP